VREALEALLDFKGNKIREFCLKRLESGRGATTSWRSSTGVWRR